MQHYDLIVIGAGSGGMKSAKLAAEQGKKVVVIENDSVGGTCVNRGCMPKKIIFYSANMKQKLTNYGLTALGWELGTNQFSWEKLQATVTRIVAILSKKNTERLENSNIPILHGSAKFIDKNTISVTNHGELTADTIVVAIGGEPKQPQIPGKEHVMVSDDVFKLPHLPTHLVVVGGGYIAIEFACMFRALGSKVTLVQRNEVLLRNFDRETVDLLIEQMRHAGIELHFNTELTKVEKNGDQLNVHLSNGKQLTAGKVLAAIGRVMLTPGLGLEEVGVKLRKDGTIITDASMQTSQSNIYAVGDVTGNLALTPVAARQAEIFISTLYGKRDPKLRVEYVPKAVFSFPPLASVGLTEEEAKQTSSDVRVYRNIFTSLEANIVKEHKKTLFKIITVGKEEQVVGFHALADEAADIIQIAAIALTSGVTKTELDRTIKLHPTISEELLFSQP